jgi:hypothetical protein
VRAATGRCGGLAWTLYVSTPRKEAAVGKEVLGTSEISRICRCSPRLVSQWIDSGRLVGYQLPGSRTRRATRDNLLAFMRAHKMPAEWYAVLER